MRIFRLRFDYDTGLQLKLKDLARHDAIGNAMSREEPLVPTWRPLSLTRDAACRVRQSDFVRLPWAYAEFGVSDKAAEVLRPLLGGTCEWLPIKHGGRRYWAIYVRPTSDCLDIERTPFYGSDRSPRTLQAAVFVPDRVPQQALFRLPKGFDYFITQDLKAAIEVANLTGIHCPFMWSDDGWAPEIVEQQPPRTAVRRVPRKLRSPTPRDGLLQRLWHEVILPRGDEPQLEESLRLARVRGQTNRYDSLRAIRRLIKQGATKDDLLDLAQCLAYEVTFEVLTAIEEEGLDESPALASLHEDLLAAEPR